MPDDKPKNLCIFSLMRMRYLTEPIPYLDVIFQALTMPLHAACDAAQSISSK